MIHFLKTIYHARYLSIFLFQQLNPISPDMTKETSITIPELNSVESDNKILIEKPDRKYIIHYDFYNVKNNKFFAKGLYEYEAGNKQAIYSISFEVKLLYPR